MIRGTGDRADDPARVPRCNVSWRVPQVLDELRQHSLALDAHMNGFLYRDCARIRTTPAAASSLHDYSKYSYIV